MNLEKEIRAKFNCDETEEPPAAYIENHLRLKEIVSKEKTRNILSKKALLKLKTKLASEKVVLENECHSLQLTIKKMKDDFRIKFLEFSQKEEQILSDINYLGSKITGPVIKLSSDPNQDESGHYFVHLFF